MDHWQSSVHANILDSGQDLELVEDGHNSHEARAVLPKRQRVRKSGKRSTINDVTQRGGGGKSGKQNRLNLIQVNRSRINETRSIDARWIDRVRLKTSQ